MPWRIDLNMKHEVSYKAISGGRWELVCGFQTARNNYPDPVILQVENEIIVLQNKEGWAHIDRYEKVNGVPTEIRIY